MNFFNNGQDQLRWGQKGGEFKLKEVKAYLSAGHTGPNDPSWRKIWMTPQWPEIKIFMWLILHQKVLTWENRINRGHIGAY